MRLSFKLGIALAVLAFATSVFASTVTFSYGDGSTLAVTGTLNGTFSAGIFTATSGSGYYNLYLLGYEGPITLVPASLSGNFGYNWNNQVFYPGDGNGNHVDYLGLMFDMSGVGYANLCATTACANDGNNGYTNLTGFAGNTPVTATFSSPTPEPSTLLMMGSGLIGLAGLARKRLFS
jgi:hypothetical protein